MKYNRVRIFIYAFILSVLFGATARAELSLPVIFSDHMVLQFGQKVPVWGTAGPGQEVTVTFRGFLAHATTGADGRWKAEIGPLNIGGPDRLIVSSGGEVIALDDVLTGEVWLCSGQSNMEMTVNRCLNAEQEIASANFPRIRQFKVAHLASAEPLDDLKPLDDPSYLQVWQPASPETVVRFTAAGYFCARELHQHLGEVPVGIINSSWGGSVAEGWVSEAGLASDPKIANIPEEWTEYAKQRESWLKDYNEFLEIAEKAEAEGQPRPVYYRQPSGLFNAMIAPLVGYGIRGVLWYQGEANVFRAAQYKPLFQALIADWRKQWGRELPFIWAQLPNFDTPVQNWAPLRESQAAALALEGTAMAVTIDVGEQYDIHPKDKQTVGYRLALAARGLVYLEEIPFRAPLLEYADFSGGSCVVGLTETADSLVASDGQPLRGFALAGQDKHFFPAQAVLENGRLRVTSDSVSDPAAVRYGWENWPPSLNLYSRYLGRVWLPATPFRTDEWDIPTYTESAAGN